MDSTSAERQELQRQRDRENGIVYLQVRISEETRDILREHARGKKMKLAGYVRDRLDAIADQIVRQNSAQHSLPGCEKSKPKSVQPQTPITPETQAKLQAILDALTPSQKPRPEISGRVAV